MGNYEQLKQSVSDVIKTNGNQEITGSILQNVLLTIISSVGANATFAGIATPTTNPGTPDGPVFYLASEGGTYTNFSAIELQDGLSVLMWNGSWSSQQIFSIDDEPTAGSDNLVKSGGVQEELALGAVYDVSAKNPTAGVNNDGKFESLSALLGDTNLNTLIPTSVRKGGMSIKFVQSSDNKYVQARCMAQNFTTDVTQWQSVDDEPTVGSQNLVKNNNIAVQLNEGKALTEMYLGKGHLSSAGIWSNIDDSFHAVLPIKNGDVIKVKRSTQPCVIGILKEYSTPVSYQSIEYATGESRRVISSTDLTTITVASSNAKYLVVVLEVLGNTGHIPSEMTVNGYDVKKSIQQHIADIMESLKSPFVVGSDDDVLQQPQFSISGLFYASKPTTFYPYVDYDISDYFAVEAGDEIVLNTVVPTTVCAILLYNRNKDLIGFVSGTTDSIAVSTFDVLISDYPTAKYARVCGRHGYTHNAVVKKPAMSPSDMEDAFRENITKASEADVLSKQKTCSLASAKNFMGHSVTNLPSRKYQLFICYGQSLSDGSDSLHVEDPVVEGAYMVGNIVGSGTELTPLQLGAGNRQHPIVSCVNSLTTLFKKYNNKYFDFVAASYGAGGKSIAQLSKASRIQQYAQDYDYDIKGAGQYENVFLAGLDNAIKACGNGNVECPAIIFLQGERDYVTDSQAPDPMPGSVDAAYACGGDKDLYKSRMMDLKNDMQADIMSKFGQTYKPIFCIYEVSGAFIKNDKMTINMAQIEFAQENDDVFLMPSPYFVPDYGAHLSTNGYRWYGEFLAKALFGILCQDSYWKPILPYQYKVDDSKIIISLENNVGKLQFDATLVEQSTNNGFAVYINDSYSASNISSVEIDDNHIVITCNQSLTGKKVEVVYGGNKTSGSGNVRDNDVFQAMYTYWNDVNDHGADGTKTIGNRPDIVGQKYPMYNWLASFYQLVNNPT